MQSSIIVPLATLVVGWGLALLTERSRDQRSWRASRAANQYDLLGGLLEEVAGLHASSHLLTREFCTRVKDLEQMDTFARWDTATLRCQALVRRIQDEPSRSFVSDQLLILEQVVRGLPEHERSYDTIDLVVTRTRSVCEAAIDRLGDELRRLETSSAARP